MALEPVALQSASGPQLRLAHDADQYSDFEAEIGGHIKLMNPDTSAPRATLVLETVTPAAGENIPLAFKNPAGMIRTYFNSEGMLYTQGWITSDGGLVFTTIDPVTGEVSVAQPNVPNAEYMFAAICDLEANGMGYLARGNNAGGWAFGMQTDDQQAEIAGGDYRWRWGVDNVGVMWFGDGQDFTTFYDTNLYRSSANVLATDDLFLANGGVQINGGTSGSGVIVKTPVSGLVIRAVGGSATDFVLSADSGVTIVSVPTGTAVLEFATSPVMAAGMDITGGASGSGRIFATAASGLVIRGVTGSGTDFALLGDSGATVASVPTGTITLTFAAGIHLANAAPGTLADGQIWYDGTNLKARLGGVTKTITVA